MTFIRNALVSATFACVAAAASAAPVVPDATPGTTYNLTRTDPVTGQRDRGPDGVAAYYGGYRVRITPPSGTALQTQWIGAHRIFASRDEVTTDFIGFCSEPYADARLNGGAFDVASSLSQTMPAALSGVAAAREDAMDRLFSNAFALVKGDRTSMAFQLAVWEVLNETGSTFGSDGDFEFTHGWGLSSTEDALSRSAVALADEWLGKLNSTTEFQKRGTVSYAAFISDSEQNMIGAAPVPLPAAAALLPVALGALFGLGRRRA